MVSRAFRRLASWQILLASWQAASKGKRSAASVARFEHRLADNLLELSKELLSGSYRPGGYRSFHIREPKRRRISAAPFRDRIVHHALCRIIEPRFERCFIGDSYANRVGKGTHHAIDRLQHFAQRYRYVLRMDVVQHFPSIDHAILIDILRKKIPERDVMALVRRIVASGEGVLDAEYDPVYFPHDDLLAALRPRGLPIGNLTSQFWSNCYLHPLDLFVKRALSWPAYLRYVDDFCLFGNSKAALYRAKQQIIEMLQSLRLTIHENAVQVQPVRCGIPWLGFVVYPQSRRVKARKVRHTTRHLSKRYDAWRSGAIEFKAFDASVQGWINHVRQAETRGLRTQVLGRFELARARVDRPLSSPERIDQ